MSADGQQLHAICGGARVADGLAARTSDPLWMLSQQYLSGEFTAENGGTPNAVAISLREHPLASLTRDGVITTVDQDLPLDFLVEAEGAAGEAPGWRSDALEYRFEAATEVHDLTASDYHGRGLDWFHFDLQGLRPGAAPPISQLQFVPGMLQFAGAPSARWWSFESGDAYFDSPADPEPNLLSLLLPEFFLVDIDNWFVVPLPQTAGSIREIVALTVTDSFGVTTVIPATAALDPTDGWNVFALTDKTAPAATAPVTAGNLLFVPNVAKNVLDNNDLEEVVFVRDGDANLVWAVERRYFDKGLGCSVQRGEPAPEEAEPAPSSSATSGLPRYIFRSPTPSHWIPYVPKFVDPAAAGVTGEVYLRRGRTVEDVGAVQYRGEILAASWRLDEHEIPPTAISVKRQQRSATGSDGVRYSWIGRYKAAAVRLAAPGLNFDYLDEPTAE